jgi:hypothetical protein
LRAGLYLEVLDDDIKCEAGTVLVHGLELGMLPNQLLAIYTARPYAYVYIAMRAYRYVMRVISHA